MTKFVEFVVVVIVCLFVCFCGGRGAIKILLTR